MATLTLKNVEDELYLRLKERARRNRRSLNQEAIACLESAVGTPAVSLSNLRASIDRQRAAGVWVKEADVERYIDEGHR